MAIMDRVRRGEHDLADVPSELLPMVRAALDPDPVARPTLSALLADLQPPQRRGPRWGRRPADEATMPFALAVAREDDDATDVIATDQRAAQPDEARTVAETLMTGPPPPAPKTTPLTSVQQAARAPYQQPAPPAETAPPATWQPPPNGAARVQRGLLLGGFFALVALAFALAPYLSLAAVGVAALALRTWSWTSEAARDRAWRRGRRWYDGPLAAASSPWYLLVATGGTVMLVVWSAALAFLVGAGLLLFRFPAEPGLLLMGAVLAFSMWWGPGGRRVRVPTRSLVLGATRWGWLGWTSTAVVGASAAVSAYLLFTAGVTWDPMPGPPWREGTILGDLARWL